MAPARKRQKVAANLKSNPLASMEDVCKVRLCLKDWINDLYDMRHGLPESEKRAWPVEMGGSFQTIVQRAWSDMDTLLNDSLKLLKCVGLVDDSADLSHMEKWLKMKERERGLREKSYSFQKVQHLS